MVKSSTNGRRRAPGNKVKTVAITGTAAINNHLANEEPEWVELWAVNRAYKFMDRVDRQFELHELAEIKRVHQTTWVEYFEYLQHVDHPVMMHEKFPAFPTSEAFPFNAIIAHFGRYATSTIAWMMAYAMMEGYKHIKLYGIDMAKNLQKEYGHQKPCIEHFIGLARGPGGINDPIIEVTVPDSSMLMKGPLYALEEDLIKDMEMRIETLKLEEQKLLGQLQANAAMRNESRHWWEQVQHIDGRDIIGPKGKPVRMEKIT